eukprot:jgi/Galph1/4340/GphlegSOOS_G3018.1
MEAIFLRGALLQLVHHYGLFKDCKDFVDGSLKDDPSIILERFNHLIQSNPSLDKQILSNFVTENFNSPGSETFYSNLQEHVPNWQQIDSSLEQRFDPILSRLKGGERESLFSWIKELFRCWQSLCLEVKPEVLQHPSRYSLIPWKKPMIVAGGRFREFYYWDSYFIIKGLISCGLFSLAKNMVDNLVDMVFQYGFVPNGGRVYYLNRSQPPLLSDMVVSVVEAWEEDNQTLLSFMKRALEALEREYQFFMKIVAVPNEQGIWNRYFVETTEPRPESFCSDTKVTQTLSKMQQAICFCGLASAAESGWDFSSRWLEDESSLNTIVTQYIVPVCLNSILLRMEGNISLLYKKYLGLSSMEDVQTVQQRIDWFDKQRKLRAETLKNFLWDKDAVQWRDYDLRRQSFTQRKFQSAVSNYLPLWSNAIELLVADWEQAQSLVEGFETSGLLQQGGVITTTFVSGQQWDSPNAWAPLQDMLIEGFLALERFAPGCGAQRIASQIASRYIHVAYYGWRTTGYMYEKYNGLVSNGASGGGGEYEPQIGFGWSNGVALSLLCYRASLLDPQTIF